MRITISLSDLEYNIIEKYRKDNYPGMKKISRMIKSMVLEEIHEDLSFEREMYESLKDNCGGICITEPEECNCFGYRLDDDDFVFHRKEDCPHYDAMAYYIGRNNK